MFQGSVRGISPPWPLEHDTDALRSISNLFKECGVWSQESFIITNMSLHSSNPFVRWGLCIESWHCLKWLLQILCLSNLQKRVFVCARSLCWWCHCQGHRIPMAHDNYRNCGYHLCSPVLFPSKSTCQRGENGKDNLVSFILNFILFGFFSMKKMITYLHSLPLTSSKWDQHSVFHSGINFEWTLPSFYVQDVWRQTHY